MRSNQLSYPAIILIAGAKVVYFCLSPKFFYCFFALFIEKGEKEYILMQLYMKFALSLQKKYNHLGIIKYIQPNHVASELQVYNFKIQHEQEEN